mgnify:CR=1 FL=1
MNTKKTKSNNLFLLKIIYKSCPSIIYLELMCGFITGIWNAADVWFVKLFYDFLSDSLNYNKIISLIFVMILFFLFNQIWFQLCRYVIRPLFQQKLKYSLHMIFFDVAKKSDLSNYDCPDFYDNYVWALNQSDNQASKLLSVISNIVVMIITIIATTSILLSVSILMAILSIVSAAWTIVLRSLLNKIEYEKDKKQNSLNKESSYYERLFGTAEFAKEIRVSNVLELIKEKYIKNQTKVRDLNISYKKKGLKYDIPLKLISELMQPIVYAILLYQIIVTKTATIGGLAVTFASFWNLRGRLQAIIDLSLNFPQISMYTKKIRTFIEKKSDIVNGSISAGRLKSLEFRFVFFSYDNKKNVLKNINLKIKKGEKIAIVGYNGSGKTTFLKLLMRLYDPTSGSIIYNGRELKDYDYYTYRNRIGVVFQDFQIYSLSIAENVLANSFEKTESQERTIIDSLNKTAFQFEKTRFHNGLQTQLTREFDADGVCLSGGEAQKVAISRIFANNYDLILLDEPSASLDVEAECELNDAIKRYAKNKTVVFISHRLSTIKLADQIYMFDDGKIIEKGSHFELMKLNGKYAEMYNLQAQQYKS